MSVYRLCTEQRFAQPLAEVFPFFSEASNLEAITPRWLRFKILTAGAIEMQVGRRIDYRLRILGIPLYWQSEITSWNPVQSFVDEQRRGPYTVWHHEHCFRAEGSATVMQDIVHYQTPGGALVNTLFVAPQLRQIFGYRLRRLREIFTVQGESQVQIDRVEHSPPSLLTAP